MSYDYKHLMKFFKDNGFKSHRTNGKHEIFHDGYSQIPMPRSKSIGSHDCRNVMQKVKQAVKRREELMGQEGIKIMSERKEPEMKPTLSAVWPTEVEKPKPKPDLATVMKGLLDQGKGYGEISIVLNHMGVTSTTGKPLIALTARRLAENLGLAERVSPWANKVKKEKDPEPTTKRAYVTTDEKEAELTIKVIENIITTPDVKASKRLMMVKRIIETSDI